MMADGELTEIVTHGNITLCRNHNHFVLFDARREPVLIVIETTSIEVALTRAIALDRRFIPYQTLLNPQSRRGRTSRIL